ncbi:MAG: carbohydrate ABC transporter permease [Acidimicrobiaceae bacterium]|nr:carbohydrate ABC transporter permease [Acidimicrobiaceae bacterium]MDE0515285.1 carbohydrate ABC transporter permease [Acidimicrobiaceae bacterium]
MSAAKNSSERRGPLGLSRRARVGAYAVLVAWSAIVLFPIYWMATTSFKAPLDVNAGPVYLPAVDYEASTDAWNYIVNEEPQTVRAFVNTVIVGTVSSLLTLVFAAAASYGLSRMEYRPRIASVAAFIGGIAVAAATALAGLAWQFGILLGLAFFAASVATWARRFEVRLSNDDIAFWLISQRILPPIAIVLPLYVFFQQLGLLDTRQALIITYVGANVPIAIWLLRDFFASIPVHLEEAAAIDGASRLQTLRLVVLPAALPGLVATFLFILVFAWNEFIIASVLTAADAQTMPMLVVAQNATRGPQWWNMSVLILIMSVPVVLMAGVLERFIARGLLVGAVKG